MDSQPVRLVVRLCREVSVVPDVRMSGSETEWLDAVRHVMMRARWQRGACLLLAAVAHAAQKPTCKPVVWANARFEFNPEASPAAASQDPPLSFCQMYGDQTCCNRVRRMRRRDYLRTAA